MATKTAIASAPSQAAFTSAVKGARTVQRKTSHSVQHLPPTVQRKEQPTAWMRNSSPTLNNHSVQRKISVGAENDSYEKEADTVADQVVGDNAMSVPTISKIPSSDIQRKPEIRNSSLAKTSNTANTLNRNSSNNEQRSNQATLSSDTSPPEAASSLQHLLDNQSSRGSPMPNNVQAAMQQKMGADFSSVRIHDNPTSHEAAQSLNARAFTQGSNIHFAQGEYNPQSKEGQRLLAHELTHTVQQNAAPTSNSNQANDTQVEAVAVSRTTNTLSPAAEKISTHQNTQASPAQSINQQKGKKELKNLSPFYNPLKKITKADAAKEKASKKETAAPPAPTKKQDAAQEAQNLAKQLKGVTQQKVRFKPNPPGAHKNNEVQKQQSEQIATRLLGSAAVAATHILSKMLQVKAQLQIAESIAQSSIKINEILLTNKTKQQAIKERAMLLKAKKQALGSISGTHKKTTAAINAAYIKSLLDLITALRSNKSLSKKLAEAQYPIIAGNYTKAALGFVSAGARLGKMCRKRQKARAQKEFISKLKHESDGVLDGPYTDNKKKAKAKAAIDVGKGFSQSLNEAGQSAGLDILKGMPKDFAEVSKKRAEMDMGLLLHFSNSFTGISRHREQGIKQANAVKKSMQAAVNKTYKQALQQINAQEQLQLKIVRTISLAQSLKIKALTLQSIIALQKLGLQKIKDLLVWARLYKGTFEQMNSPPPAMLSALLLPPQIMIVAMGFSTAALLQKNATKAIGQINKLRQNTIGGTQAIITQLLGQMSSDVQKAIKNIGSLRKNGVSTIQRNGKAAIGFIKSSATLGVQNMGLVLAGFIIALARLVIDLNAGLTKVVKDFTEGLQTIIEQGKGENKSLLATSIEAEQKAAAQVQPRWKKVVKVLIVVLVIAITIAVAPALIGFIGAAVGGGAFGAAVGAVVGGAILGAGGSAVTTIGNNLVDGQSAFKGVGAAMLEGAITGALAGGIGRAAGGIAGHVFKNASSGIASTIGKFGLSEGLDLAGNIAVDYGAAKITGREFSVTDTLRNQAIGLGASGAASKLPGFKHITVDPKLSAEKGGKIYEKVTGKQADLSTLHPDFKKPSTEPTPQINNQPSAAGNAGVKPETTTTTKPESTKPASDSPAPAGPKPSEESGGTTSTKPSEESSASTSSKPNEEAASTAAPKPEQSSATPPKPTEESAPTGGAKQEAEQAGKKAEDAVSAKEKTEVDEHGQTTKDKEEAAARGLTEGGISAKAALELSNALMQHASKLGDKFVVMIRPVSDMVIKLRAEGLLPKPEALKMKTVKETDIPLGAKPEDIGKVGFFEPIKPADFEQLPKAVQDRYKERQAEYNQLLPEVQNMIEQKSIRVEDGLVVHAESGKAYTGDNDLYDIRTGSLKGDSIDLKDLPAPLLQVLTGGSIQVQHGPHLSWQMKGGSGAVDMFAKIVREVRPPGEYQALNEKGELGSFVTGKEKLVIFTPDGKISYDYDHDL